MEIIIDHIRYTLFNKYGIDSATHNMTIVR